MASMVFLASSHLNSQSHVQLRTNSKYFYPPSSWIPSPSTRVYYNNVHLSYNLESSKSSFIQSRGFSSFSLPKSSSIFSPHSNVITAQGNDPLHAEDTIYKFTAKKDRKEVYLNDYRGKVLLIVNIPEQSSEKRDSEIKFLNGLYDLYKSEGLEILGFQYDEIETSSTSEHKKNDQKERRHIIRDMVSSLFHNKQAKIDTKTAHFPIFDKVTLNGENEDAVWKFLKSYGGGDIENEFTMFLIDRRGYHSNRLLRFGTQAPQSYSGGRPKGRDDMEDDIEDAIKNLLHDKQVN